jgi:hypothetical protein
MPLLGRSTPGVRKALQAAKREAGAPDEPVGSHHLLLGLIDDERGLAAKVLERLGVTRGAVVDKIAEIGVHGTSDGPPPVRVVKARSGVEFRIDDPELAERVSGIDAVTAGDLLRRALLEHLGRDPGGPPPTT